MAHPDLGPTGGRVDKDLQRNVAAFEEKLEELLKAHRDEVVLMKDGQVVSFHKTHEEAFGAGYKQFGHSGFFAQLVQPAPAKHEAACLH
jgi:hypothetical protein